MKVCLHAFFILFECTIFWILMLWKIFNAIFQIGRPSRNEWAFYKLPFFMKATLENWTKNFTLFTEIDRIKNYYTILSFSGGRKNAPNKPGPKPASTLPAKTGKPFKMSDEITIIPQGRNAQKTPTTVRKLSVWLKLLDRFIRIYSEYN